MIGWLLWGFSALALSESYYAEVSAGFSATQAFRVHQQLVSEGSSTRLVRRYRQGIGWEYVLSSPRFQTAEAAESHGRGWMGLVEGGVAIYSDAQPEPGQSISQNVSPLPTTEVLIARVSRMLGGVGGGTERLSSAGGLQFVYEREVFEDEHHFVAQHVYTVSGGERVLETQLSNEEGVASRAVLSNGAASFRTGSAEAQQADPRAVADLLDRMGPAGVFAFVLDLPRLLGAKGMYDSLQIVDTTACGVRVCAVLASVGESGGGQLVIDPVDWWVVEASLLGDMGLVQYRFRDWREIDTNLVVPFEFELVRGTHVLEKIRVQDFSLEN